MFDVESCRLPLAGEEENTRGTKKTIERRNTSEGVRLLDRLRPTRIYGYVDCIVWVIVLSDPQRRSLIPTRGSLPTPTPR